MENPVLIFGANSLGLAVYDIFKSNKVEVFGFLDDNSKLHNTEIDEVSVLGATDNEGFTKFIGKKCEYIIAIENNKERQKIVEDIIEDRKQQPVNAIHDRAYISPTALLSHGSIINANTFIGTNCKIDSYSIIGANVTIDSGSAIGEYVFIGNGSNIATGVVIEHGAYIGVGCTIISGIKIGKNARVGAGSVVMTDIKASQTVFGVPAVEVKK